MVLSSCQEDNPYDGTIEGYEILTPKPGSKPQINGPLVYGARPGNPFLYRIPCQGERPISYAVEGLPSELTLDASTGIITGTTPSEGEYLLALKASNSHGEAERRFKVVAGEKLALTPPMGWNYWYAHYWRISDVMIREAADIMISSGMADVGYQYVNLDDCWMLKKRDSLTMDQLRDESGNVLTNKKFPDMKGLTNYIHDKGLKAGIYSSPGPLTCAQFTGSYQHEEQDARQYADWGFDFLKYDWCSYSDIGGKDPDLEAAMKPFRKMGDLLKHQNRDIVYNLCQFAIQNAWEWGAEVGGHSWRTAGDLVYYIDELFDVALKNATHREYSKPGEWNDPDFIMIGWFGNVKKFSAPEPTKMMPSTQYAYMSLWSLMASPIFFGGDMTKLDEFTLNILCNADILEVNQDPLGESGMVIHHSDSCFLMVKNLVDGSKAVGLFNRGKEAVEVTAQWEELEVDGKQMVRDIWRQKDIGKYKEKFSAIVPAQGVVMVKISKP
ncbi:MAG: alpha-galactosidase [Nitrospirae bacterium]|nr:alpha-galactosidase [Nitrospirota bacterium]